MACDTRLPWLTTPTIRLTRALLRITTSSDSAGSETDAALQELHVAALMASWSIVDAIDRLRGLIGTRGNIMRGFAPFNEFRTKTASTRTLRNRYDSTFDPLSDPLTENRALSLCRFRCRLLL